MSSQELSVPTILNIAKICQYLAANSISGGNNFKGKALDERLSKMIYCERKAVEYRYDSNPGDPTLIGTANYLYTLLGRFALLARARLNILQIAPPVIAGPADVNINVGQNAVFTAGVTSAVPATYQWFDGAGNIIVGATSLTLTIPNAQLTDSGKTFYMTATNPAGTVKSRTAVMIVNAQIGVFLWFGDTDPFPALNGGTDNLAYQLSQNITHNANIAWTMPLASANNQYQVMKQPITEKTKTSWFNTINNQGTLDPTGDQNWRASIIIGSFRYYITRQAISIDLTVLSESFNG